MNNTQWDRLKLAHYQANKLDNTEYNSAASANSSCKFVGPNNQLLSLVADTCSSHKVIRHLRIFCKTTFEFIEEIPLEETNKKYLCRIFNLASDDELLLSYKVNQCQKKYMQLLAGRKLDFERFDYFMVNSLSV